MSARLLLIAGSYPPDSCGVGDYTASLARSLAARENQEVHVLTSAGASDETEDDGIIVHRVMKGWGIRNLARLARILRQVSPDMIHIQYPTQGYGWHLFPWLLPLLCHLLGSRVTQTWHEGFSLWRAPLLALLALAPGPVVVVRPNFPQVLHPWLRWVTRYKRLLYVQSASSIPRADLDPAAEQHFRADYPVDRKLLVFFGFLYPSKGVDRIFEFADPDRDYLVIAGALPETGEYLKQLKQRAACPDWEGHTRFEGLVSATHAASLLAVAEAVVLPFEQGGGEWNSSLQAAVANHAFIVTTSHQRQGYDPAVDTYYARPGNNEEMGKALVDRFSGRLRPNSRLETGDDWERIAHQHLAVYAGSEAGRIQA